MPWPYLPEDFREKYRSVWVDIPNSLYDPVRGHELYNVYLDELEYAEECGFDGTPRQRLRSHALSKSHGRGISSTNLQVGSGGFG